MSDRNGNSPKLTVCGVVGVTFGALGLVLSFIPIINNVAAILGFIGLVLSIVAMVGTFRGRKHGKALSVVAAVLSVLAIVITFAMQAAASKAIDDSLRESKGITTSQASSGSAANAVQDQEGDIEGAHVKIVSAAKSGNDYQGHPTVLVTYEWTNRTEKNNSFMTLINAQAFQNGSALDTAVYFEPPSGYDANSAMAESQPNATATVTVGYVLKDDSPVDVEVSALFSVSDKSTVKHTFTLQ